MGLPGQVTGHCCVRSPLRDDDRSPSFSIFANGTRWRDPGTGQGGDSFDLYQALTKTNPRAAWPPFIDLSRVLHSLIGTNEKPSSPPAQRKKLTRNDQRDV